MKIAGGRLTKGNRFHTENSCSFQDWTILFCISIIHQRYAYYLDFDNLCKKYQLLKFGYIIAKYCLKDIPTVRKTPPRLEVFVLQINCIYIYIYFRGVHICIPWILIFDHVCDRLSHFCKKKIPLFYA